MKDCQRKGSKDMCCVCGETASDSCVVSDAVGADHWRRRSDPRRGGERIGVHQHGVPVIALLVRGTLIHWVTCVTVLQSHDSRRDKTTNNWYAGIPRRESCQNVCAGTGWRVRCRSSCKHDKFRLTSSRNFDVRSSDRLTLTESFCSRVNTRAKSFACR